MSPISKTDGAALPCRCCRGWRIRLELDKQRLFLLAHPEAHWIVGKDRESAPAKRQENAWRKFVRDRGTLARHKVTGRELKVLQKVNMLGRISAPNQFLFILNAIRQAVEEE